MREDALADRPWQFPLIAVFVWTGLAGLCLFVRRVDEGLFWWTVASASCFGWAHAAYPRADNVSIVCGWIAVGWQCAAVGTVVAYFRSFESMGPPSSRLILDGLDRSLAAGSMVPTVCSLVFLAAILYTRRPVDAGHARWFLLAAAVCIVDLLMLYGLCRRVGGFL